MSLKVPIESKHIVRRALFVMAGECHVDRFEIEARRLDGAQVLDVALVAGPSKRKNVTKFTRNADPCRPAREVLAVERFS